MNIGLILSLVIYFGVDEYGFFVIFYFKVDNGKVLEEVCWFWVDEEVEVYVVLVDILLENGEIKGLL